MSAPSVNTSSSGATTFPRDLLIFAPSAMMWPWLYSRRNGSPKFSSPMSRNALVKNRAYIRCMTACSAPPVYWSTGAHASAWPGPHGSVAFLALR